MYEFNHCFLKKTVDTLLENEATARIIRNFKNAFKENNTINLSDQKKLQTLFIAKISAEFTINGGFGNTQTIVRSILRKTIDNSHGEDVPILNDDLRAQFEKINRDIKNTLEQNLDLDVVFSKNGYISIKALFRQQLVKQESKIIKIVLEYIYESVILGKDINFDEYIEDNRHFRRIFEEFYI